MEFPKSRILSTQQLIQHIIESNRNGERFCFILGAGASVESGIPSGNTLEKRWMDCIMGEEKDLDTPPMNTECVRQLAANLYKEKLIEHDFDEIENAWKEAKEARKSIPSIYYFDIYKLRFHPSRRNGYRYLEQIMDNKNPSLGYHTLAKLLTETNLNNLVITTNFDSLVEDALFLYTDKKPLVVSHESLTGYIEANIHRPIIAKVHRGLMYEPFNSPETTDELKDEWRKALNYAFNTYTPIVIGYGGGDRSLMAFLEENTTSMRNGVYWCYRDATGLPEENIQKFVKEKDGCLVTIGGFDALMMEIGTALYKDEITPTGTEEYLKAQCNKRVSKYNEQWNDLNKKPEMKPVLQPINEAEQLEEKKREEDNKLTSWDHMRRGDRAYDERNYQEAINEYSKAIDLNPGDEIVYYNRGLAYDSLEQYEKAIEDYNKAIEIDPNFAPTYNNRGNAYNSLGQCDQAIEDYNKSIELEPDYARAYANRGVVYGNLGQHDKAIENHTKAIELDPDFAPAYNNRGVVYGNLGQHNKAIMDCNKAIELEPNYAPTYDTRGTIYFNLGEYYKSIDDYTKAIGLDLSTSNLKIAYKNRAKAYRAIGEDALAEADEKSAEEL